MRYFAFEILIDVTDRITHQQRYYPTYTLVENMNPEHQMVFSVCWESVSVRKQC